jgi:hypothetical protein
MATVTPVPFAVGLLFALIAFGALLCLLVRESRRPFHWPEPNVVEELPSRPHLRIVHPFDDAPPARKVGHTRLAVVLATFLLWSVWSTGRPDRVDPHH